MLLKSLLNMPLGVRHREHSHRMCLQLPLSKYQIVCLEVGVTIHPIQRAARLKSFAMLGRSD
jgi:hypothetical protein